MTTRNDESQRRKFNFRMLEGNRIDVAFDVIHRRERLVFRESECFRIGEPNKKRSDQSWSRCCCNPIDSIQIEAGIGERLVHNRLYLQEMFARSELRNNPAVRRVSFYLRVNNVGKDFPSIAYD